MSRYWLGCCGWAYDDWVGPFYPEGTAPGEFLERYGRVFRTVEVDSSFYRPPDPSQLRRWADATPPEFRFSLKVPRSVTHEPLASAADDPFARFVASLFPLQEAKKVAAILLQFPPSFRRPRDEPRFTSILETLDRRLRFAVELRHKSWWVPETRKALEERGAALAWSVVPTADPPPWVTADFLYCRLVGDRELQHFDRVQRDRRSDLERMRLRLNDEGRAALEVFAYSNNHFMGFGPGTVAELARVLDDPIPDLGRASRIPGQSTLDLS